MAVGVRVSVAGLQISKSEVRRENVVLEVPYYAETQKRVFRLPFLGLPKRIP